nr:putative uncharacterized protein C21orf62-AS1 isoform X2 [Gorilla gorilla gorilla]
MHHVRQLMMPICPMALNSTTSSSTTFGAFRIMTLNVEEWATAWKVLILLEAAVEEEKRSEEKRILVCWNMWDKKFPEEFVSNFPTGPYKKKAI